MGASNPKEVGVTHPHIAFAENWFRRIWVDQDESAIDELFPVPTIAKGLGEDRVGPEEFKGFHRAMLGLVQDARVEILESVSQGDRSAMLSRFTATCCKTGRRVSMTGTSFVRFEAGKAADVQDHWDFITFYEQLGLLPKQTFFRALSGESLAPEGERG